MTRDEHLGLAVMQCNSKSSCQALSTKKISNFWARPIKKTHPQLNSRNKNAQNCSL